MTVSLPLCRGPNMFAGYFGRAEATAEVLRDGFGFTPAIRSS